MLFYGLSGVPQPVKETATINVNFALIAIVVEGVWFKCSSGGVGENLFGLP